MKGDFSRVTFDRQKEYTAVLMQQGRVQVDADWNEQQAIQNDARQTQGRDTIGLCGAPKRDPGFAITVQGASTLQIGAGLFYVDGLRCRNPLTLRYVDQESPAIEPTPLEIMQGDNVDIGLVYLDVWQQLVTAADDDSIREKALGGPDTATRLQTRWRVRFTSLGVDSVDTDDLRQRLRQEQDLDHPRWTTVTAALNAATRGRLRASTDGTDPQTDPCILPPDAGYRGLENQLYRVEVHRGGGGGNATFKWSRDNGSIVAAVTAIGGNTITVDHLGLDDVSGFVVGQWVEITDDIDVQRNQPGQLLQISDVDQVNRQIEVTLPGGASGLEFVINRPFTEMIHPKLRRWDQTTDATNDGVPLSETAIDLERGIQITFQDDGRTYRTGDYWLIPARTATGQLEWPTAGDPPTATFEPPHGVQHHYCPLAIIRRTDSNLTADDLRLIYPQLNFLEAEDVRFDDEVCELGAQTVQEAIDLLCQRGQGGGCTFVATPGPGWESVFEQVTEFGDAKICLPAGNYPLDGPVEITGRHITVVGAGFGTSIEALTSEAALRFNDCQSVTVRDLRALCGRVGSDDNDGTDGINGVLTMIDCRTVSVSNVQLECGGGTRQAAACITVRNQPSSSDLTAHTSAHVQQCDLRVGHQQIGVLFVNVARSHVQDNYIRNGFRRPSFESMLGDLGYRALIREQLVSGLQFDQEGTEPAEIGASLQIGSFNTSFQSTVSASDWTTLQIARPPTTADMTSRLNVQTYINGLADQLLLSGGILPDLDIGLQSRLQNAVQAIQTEAVQPAVRQGIVIAGQSAREARVVNNTLYGVLEGVRAAVSHSDAVMTQIGTSLITGNTIHLASTPFPRLARSVFGIFVGNALSVVISDNRIERIISDLSGQYPDSAIKIAGHMGRRIIVTQNHCEGLPTGVRFIARGLPFTADPMWKIADNVFESASSRVHVTPTWARNLTLGLEDNYT